ncbi:MAG: beta-lactamase family protein [Oligoflexia bacterium]|nr:beta-lactamase family protein [Oligoflexia bacterium]
MPESTWAVVQGCLDQAVTAHVIPGATLSVRVRQGPGVDLVAGQAELRPRPRPVRLDTPYDLASLTKILATTPVALALWDQGVLDLDAPLTELLAVAPPGVSARHCLLHSAGLPAWRDLYQQVIDGDLSWGSASTRAGFFDRVGRTPLVAAPGQTTLYSDLGFLLLGAALEAVGGDRLDRLWERLVRPFSGVDLRWGWPGAAATEDCPVRRRVLAGQVHDLNAAVLGGIAPHAGLFGSAASVADFGAWALSIHDGQTGLGLSPAALRAAWADQGPGARRLGWDRVSPVGSSAGTRWPGDGVGHLGFTGTSLWIAPRQGVVVALCSNRVHPKVEGGARPGGKIGPRTQAFRALRPAVHDAVIDALERLGRWRG